MANVAGDDLFLLEGLRDTERVVDHRLLDRVHLREGKRGPIREEQHMGSLRFLFSVQQSSIAAEERQQVQSGRITSFILMFSCLILRIKEEQIIHDSTFGTGVGKSQVRSAFNRAASQR